MPAEPVSYDENFKPAQICPYLGLANDPGSYFQFASTWNCCHRPENVLSLKTAPQTKYCLSEAHQDCPVYQDDWDKEFPRNWIARPWERERERQSLSGRSSPDPQTRMMRTGTGLLLVTIAVFGIFAMAMPAVRDRLFSGAGQSPAENLPGAVQLTDTPSPLPAVTETPTPLTPTPIVTATPSITPSPTETPLPTDTPLPTPGPGLETPFGPEGGYLIHVVEAGESFGSIAADYATTPEVLLAANPIVQGASLWVGRQLVIPVGQVDPQGIPVFTVVFTAEADTLENLAAENNSDPELVRLYNGLGMEPNIPSGRWLIIPIVTAESGS